MHRFLTFSIVHLLYIQCGAFQVAPLEFLIQCIIKMHRRIMLCYSTEAAHFNTHHYDQVRHRNALAYYDVLSY